jgi:peptidoglycan endopeptidase LytE
MKKLLATLVALSLSLGFASVSHAQHYVQSGETMAKIARNQGMSLKDLISLNPHIKNPNLIHVGDYIVIRSETEKQKDLVDYARSLQDVTEYVWGGTQPTRTDCSGWVQSIYRKFGVNLPRTSREQAVIAFGTPVKFPELQIGDLMFFSTRADKRITHVGIYMGNDYWISNLNEAKDVEILSNWGRWTQDYFLWGQRVKL